MFWARRRQGVRSNRVASAHSNSVRAAARQTVEALETRRLFAYALTSVPIDNAPPTYPQMATDGTYVLIGQSNYDLGAADAVGQVSVVNALTGQALATIDNPDPDQFDSFGSAVAFLDGGRIAISSIEPDGEGRVYIYDSLSDTAPDIIERNDGGQTFGFHLEGIAGDKIAISTLTQSTVDTSGAVYIYDLLSLNSTPLTITSGLAGQDVDENGIDDGIANDQFGRALSADGTNILVAAQNGPGNAYASLIDSTTGQILQHFEETGNPGFGATLALTATNAFFSGGDGQRLLQYSTSGALIDTYTVPDAVNFGLAFDVAGDKLIVGDEIANDGERVYGAAYVFDLDDGPSTFETLDAPDVTSGAFGSFGTQVSALGGDRYAVLDVIFDGNGDAFLSNVHLYEPEVVDPNQAPTAEAGTYGAVNENSNILLDGGASSDPEDDELTYAWDLDNDSQYDDAFTQTVNFSRDLPGSITVGLQVSDGEFTSTDTTVLTFNDVAPTANAGADRSGVRQQTLSYAGSGNNTAGDAIALYEWDLDGDGQFDDATGANATFQYVTSGPVVVSLRVTDDDGQTAVDTATVTIVAAQLQGGDLIVGGTNAGESIEIRRDNGSGPRVFFNGVLFGTFNVTGKVVVRGGAGNDTILSQLSNTFDTEMYGDAGNDTITGGGGDDFLFGGDNDDDLFARQGDDIGVGGAGNDFVKGGGGRDVLIGGLGSDDIEGNAADDILIAGFTSHDNDLAALSSIKATWLSGNTYTSRVSTLRGGLLNNDNDVFDDAAVDTVRGGAGRDWFLVQESGSFVDVLEDLKNNEVSDDIDAA